jgi:nicotinamide-nucleotide amidase
MKLSARWLKHEHPYELEFEALSQNNVQTMTGTPSEEGVPKRLHSPKELVALGIAGCTGVDVVSILKKMRQPLENLVIELELEQTTDHPKVFAVCRLTYRYEGSSLDRDRVARATALSYGKYCGVSAMVKRSGCHFIPRVFLNGVELTDDFENQLNALHEHTEEKSAKASRAALLITGNEILSGKTQDTNGRFLARNLREMGIEASEIRVVGDDRQSLVSAVHDLLKDNDLVIMTGGLGPTKDDLTAEIVASALSRPLQFSPKAWEICTTAFANLGRKEIPESNKKQAMLPQDSVVLENSMGTAAGFAVHSEYPLGRKTLVALPGVPWECEVMFENEVKPILPQVKFPITQWGPWNIWGIGESAIQSQIKDVEARIAQKLPSVEFSFQAHAGYVTYLFKHAWDPLSNNVVDVSEEERMLERILGDKVLFKGQESLIQRLAESSKKSGITMAVAESCTGGRIAAEITSVSGSSEFFFGGIVAYSNQLKSKILMVPEEVLTLKGAVSSDVAAAMANGAALLTGSHVALSVTGIAGPTGGSKEKPVGTVVFGLSLKRLFEDTQFDIRKFHEKFARLSEQGWTLYNEKDVLLVSERKFGSHLTRDVIQKRSTVYGLCSLVAVVESVRSYGIE